MKLANHHVEKPWGRTDIPAAFGDMGGRRIGEIWYEAKGGAQLPVLVKWLFTSEKLSIQVHPNDDQARARGLASGKEECWYIVDAEPGAVIGMGTTRPLSGHELREASLSGEIEGLMDWKPVRAGDYFYIPAGTVHAIGAGITLVEVQQNADVTYRLYDYGRPRELHLDDGVAVSEAKPYADPQCGNADRGDMTVDSPYFKLRMATARSHPETMALASSAIIIPISGSMSVDGEMLLPSECAQTTGRANYEFADDCKALVVSFAQD